MGCLYCGGYIVPGKKKAPRARIYCSDVCRQRACRARSKGKRTTDYYKEKNALLQQNIAYLEKHILRLKDILAEREGEIVRLNYLLDHQSKKKRPI